ncbi:dTDP-4-dehydrorhamnose 3,5-epimerase family protein [Streptomyces sp. NPDC059524]|uniref:dTDP-4-dehydrorhamnose 3,5-epimerase family protein n=1 Tax=Streptomyces sp. NPDC059524 TaxID=3346856 RepID=UPI0036C08403
MTTTTPGKTGTTTSGGVEVRSLAVSGCFEFTPPVFRDERGLFVSPLQQQAFTDVLGHPFPIAQTNHSRSARGVMRGVHFPATPPGQAKYVHCSRGRGLDVVVDIRLGSPTFGAWDTVEMDTETFRAVYIPDGVGHAFLALEDDTVMTYLVSSPYRADLEREIDPLDPELGLPWPKDMQFIFSQRDTGSLSLAEAKARGILPRYEDCLAAAEAHR